MKILPYAGAVIFVLLFSFGLWVHFGVAPKKVPLPENATENGFADKVIDDTQEDGQSLNTDL